MDKWKKKEISLDSVEEHQQNALLLDQEFYCDRDSVLQVSKLNSKGITELKVTRIGEDHFVLPYTIGKMLCSLCINFIRFEI